MTSGTETTEPPPPSNVTDGIPVPYQDNASTSPDPNMLVVYITVPIILTAIIVSSIVITYYKK